MVLAFPACVCGLKKMGIELRLRFTRDLSQISACCLKVMLEVDSMKVYGEFVLSCSSFSAAPRSAMVRVLQIPRDATACQGSACPGTHVNSVALKRSFLYNSRQIAVCASVRQSQTRRSLTDK